MAREALVLSLLALLALLGQEAAGGECLGRVLAGGKGCGVPAGPGHRARLGGRVLASRRWPPQPRFSHALAPLSRGAEGRSLRPFTRRGGKGEYSPLLRHWLSPTQD